MKTRNNFADPVNCEIDIAKGLKAGNEKAYEYLYEHYYKMLCSVALEFVHDIVVSEMIVSDVIFALWKNRESLEINSSLRNYLIRAVRNRSLNYRKQSERQLALQAELGVQVGIEQANEESTASDPLTQLIEKELEKKINDSIDSLPEQTRKILCLSRFEGMKYEEIARETGVSVDVVKYHVKSALSRLRVMLKDYMK